jgi:hypothetical protein
MAPVAKVTPSTTRSVVVPPDTKRETPIGVVRSSAMGEFDFAKISKYGPWRSLKHPLGVHTLRIKILARRGEMKDLILPGSPVDEDSVGNTTIITSYDGDGHG